MKTALYLPKEIFPSSKLVVESIAKDFGIRIDEEIGKCLCEVPSYNEFLQYDRIIAHPHRRLSCIDTFKKLIPKNPNIDFYIIALMAHDRIERIGEHPNLKYITEEESSNGWMNKLYEK